MNKRAFNKILTITAAVMLLIVVGTSGAFSQQPVKAEKKAAGIILDSSGDAFVVEKKKIKSAFPMSPLMEGSVIMTRADGTVLFVCYADGSEINLSPDSKIIIKKGMPKVIYGKFTPVSKKSFLPLPVSSRIESRRIMGEMTRMKTMAPMENFVRRITLLKPSGNEKLFVPAIEIQWTGPSGQYVLEVAETAADEKGKDRIVFSKQVVNKGRIVLENCSDAPANIKYGKEYRITINGGGPLESISKYVAILPEKQSLILEDAWNTYEKLLKENPDDKKAVFLMANLFMENGLNRRAMELAEKLIQMDPENPYVYFFKGNLLEKTEHYSEAAEYYEKGNSLKH